MYEAITYLIGFLKQAFTAVIGIIKQGFQLLLDVLGIQNFLNKLWDFGIDAFYWVANEIIKGFAQFVSFVAARLPSLSLPNYEGTLPGLFLDTFNWIFPTQYAVSMISFFMTAVGLYFTSAWFMRKIGMIS